MRRDIGNEVIVALFALVAIVFALLFAALLSISTRQVPAPTGTGTEAATSTNTGAPISITRTQGQSTIENGAVASLTETAPVLSVRSATATALSSDAIEDDAAHETALATELDVTREDESATATNGAEDGVESQSPIPVRQVTELPSERGEEVATQVTTTAAATGAGREEDESPSPIPERRVTVLPNDTSVARTIATKEATQETALVTELDFTRETTTATDGVEVGVEGPSPTLARKVTVLPSDTSVPRTVVTREAAPTEIDVTRAGETATATEGVDVGVERPSSTPARLVSVTPRDTTEPHTLVTREATQETTLPTVIDFTREDESATATDGVEDGVERPSSTPARLASVTPNDTSVPRTVVTIEATQVTALPTEIDISREDETATATDGVEDGVERPSSTPARQVTASPSDTFVARTIATQEATQETALATELDFTRETATATDGVEVGVERPSSTPARLVSVTPRDTTEPLALVTKEATQETALATELDVTREDELATATDGVEVGVERPSSTPARQVTALPSDTSDPRTFVTKEATQETALPTELDVTREDETATATEGVDVGGERPSSTPPRFVSVTPRDTTEPLALVTKEATQETALPTVIDFTRESETATATDGVDVGGERPSSTPARFDTVLPSDTSVARTVVTIEATHETALATELDVTREDESATATDGVEVGGERPGSTPARLVSVTPSDTSVARTVVTKEATQETALATEIDVTREGESATATDGIEDGVESPSSTPARLVSVTPRDTTEPLALVTKEATQETALPTELDVTREDESAIATEGVEVGGERPSSTPERQVTALPSDTSDPRTIATKEATQETALATELDVTREDESATATDGVERPSSTPARQVTVFPSDTSVARTIVTREAALTDLDVTREDETATATEGVDVGVERPSSTPARQVTVLPSDTTKPHTLVTREATHETALPTEIDISREDETATATEGVDVGVERPSSTPARLVSVTPSDTSVARTVVTKVATRETALATELDFTREDESATATDGVEVGVERPSSMSASAVRASPSLTFSPLPYAHSRLVPTPTPRGLWRGHEIELCAPEKDWQNYVVGAGESLLAIAESIGSAITEIQRGNCFAPIRGVLIGETLRLPALPKEPPATAMPAVLGEADAISAIGCEDQLRIVSPRSGQNVYGLFEVAASWDASALSSWRLAIRPQWSERYFEFANGEVSLEGGVAALVNSEIFGVGLHWLRLSAYTSESDKMPRAVCEIPLVFYAP